MQLQLEILRSNQAADPFAFQAGRQEYVLRLPLGGVENATLDWDESLLSELAALRQPLREPARLQRLGERLRRFLATPNFAQMESELLAAVTRKEPVFVTLRLAAAELFALPWELLALSGSGMQLGALPGVLLRYAWPQTQTAPPLPERLRREGGRLLMAWSAAGGAVPAAEQEAALRRACQLGQLPFDPSHDVLPRLSSARLAQRLKDQKGSEPVSILHLLCHGGRRDNTFGLAWDSDDGGSEVVDAGQLRQLLAPYASELRLVVISACEGGNSGPLGNHLGSVAEALHRVGIAAVVASRYPLSVAGSLLLAEELYRALLGQPCSLEEAFLRTRQRLLTQPQSLDWAALQLYARPEDGQDTRPVVFRPYRGLSPFLPGQSRFFFGREKERAEARAALLSLSQAQRPRFLLVTGASGTGKSSVVLGGVIPDFVKENRYESNQSSLTHTANDIVGLLRSLSAQPQTPKLQAAISALLAELSKQMYLDGGSEWEAVVLRPGPQPLFALQEALASRRHLNRPLLLVVDQLEELFTHCDEARVRSEFVSKLWSLSRSDGGVFCVVTLRVDFLGRCGELLLDDEGLRFDRIAYSEEHRVFVAQPAKQQLAAAIIGPARLVGLEVSEALVERMVSEVVGEPGALPLLSYVLDLLWQHRDGARLSEQVYSELGGVSGALGRSADRVYFELSPMDQRLARLLLVRLVGFSAEAGGETRRRVPLAELRDEIPDGLVRLDGVLGAFVEARLLVRGEESGHPVVEFAHEALIRRWDRLQGFLKEDRQRILELRELMQWATQFAAFGTLLRGAQLGYAQRLLEKYPDELGQQVTTLIRHSLRAARRRWIGLAVTLCGIVCVLTTLLLSQRRSEQRAVAERRVAVQNERTARARLLAMHAEQTPDAEVDTALLYAARAMQLHPEHSTRSALASALVSSQPILHFLRLPPSRVHGVAFTPDSRQIVAVAGDTGLWLFDVKGGTLVGQRAVPPVSCPSCTSTELYAVAVSPDGQQVAATGQGGQIFLWPLRRFGDASSAARVIATGARTLYSLDFSPDGQKLSAGAGDGQIVRVDLRQPEAQPVAIAGDGTEIVASVAFEPGHGRRLAAVGNGGSLSIYDSSSGRRVLGPLVGGHGYLSSVAWSPSGRQVAAASEDRTVLLWDAVSGQPLHWSSGSSRPNAALSAVSFSSDGRWLASCGLDRAIHLWDVDGLRMVGTPLLAPGGPIYSCALSPSGRLLVSGSDGLLLIWEMSAHPILHKLRQPLPASALAVAPSGAHGVIGGPDGSLRPWKLSEPQPGPPQPAHSQAVNALAFSSDGGLLASGSSDGSVGLFAAPSLDRRRTFQDALHGSVMAVAISPLGDTTAAGYVDGTVALFSHGSGQRLRIIATRQQSVTALAFSPDGRLLFSGGLDGTIRSYSPESGQSLCLPARRPVHKDSVSSLTVSPTALLLASGGRDRAVVLSTWDAASGCLLRREPTLSKHTAGVTTLGFSQDGQTLASGGEDAAVILWDVSEGKPIGKPLPGPMRSISGLAFGGDGVLLAGDSETVWRWDVAESRWIDTACARAGHNLALSDWKIGLGDSPYCRVCAAYPSGLQAPADSPLCKNQAVWIDGK